MEQEPRNVMVDIETLGDRTAPILLSVSMVDFDIFFDDWSGKRRKVPDALNVLSERMETGNFQVMRTNLGEGVKTYAYKGYFNVQDCINLGMSPSRSTMEWWFSKSPEEQEEVRRALSSRCPLVGSTLEQVNSFVNDGPTLLWAKSPAFDLVHLKSAMYLCNLVESWGGRSERDVRTVLPFSPDKDKPFREFRESETDFELHDPLADCAIQCAQVIDALDNISS